MDDPRAKRLALNETVFRRANEQIRATGERLQHDFEAFMCECAEIHCDQQVPISFEKYREVREDKSRFVIVPGHENAEIERIVESHDGFSVVEKIGPGRDVAERDPLN